MLPKPKVANDLKLRTQAKTGEDIEVDLIKAARFAELPTPSRGLSYPYKIRVAGHTVTGEGGRVTGDG